MRDFSVTMGVSGCRTRPDVIDGHPLSYELHGRCMQLIFGSRETAIYALTLTSRFDSVATLASPLRYWLQGGFIDVDNDRWSSLNAYVPDWSPAL